jgi:PIN domain nuclease of toxin-antitoxin system
LALLLDTHILVWALSGDPRLPPAVRAALNDPAADLLVSAVTAFEYADLQRRGRLPQSVSFGVAVDVLALTVVGLPADVWRMAERLPDVHRDPTDRLLIAHAIAEDLMLVSADRKFSRYPVRLLA